MSENKSEWSTQLIPAAPKRADPALDPFKQMMSYYRCAAMEVETKFRVLDVQMSLNRENNPIESIKTRLKSPESIFEKLKRRDLPMTLSAIEENLNDIAGVRVICSFPEDIYLLADALLRQDDITLIERKDYIQNPKPNGYRSLHLIVEVPIFLRNETKRMRVEVQLRTIAMDFWASLEHKLRYKKGLEDSEDYQEISRQLKNCAEISAMLDRLMENIRGQIEGGREL
ncbi:GTP pyrophosphokinase [Butyricicoccus sp.]|uniref:GTP pyrophosphokinase n=1 Tax=Butyricicoccus sp. TaxID=2049021 RepID=UPI003AAA8FC0